MPDANGSLVGKNSARHYGFVLLLACAACAALSQGCNTFSGQINGSIAKRLPAMLGPADHYDVHASGSVFDLMRGKLDHVRIHGDDVALAPMLHARSFDADATDVHADTRTNAITGIGSTTFHLIMDQSDLDNYVLASRPRDYRRGARIALAQSEIVYSDRFTRLGIHMTYSVAGTLQPSRESGAELNFIPSKGSVARIRIPEPILKAVVARQNPVVSLAQMAYPVNITSTRVAAGTLVVDGSVDLSSLVGKDANHARPPKPHA